MMTKLTFAAALLLSGAAFAQTPAPGTATMPAPSAPPSAMAPATNTPGMAGAGREAPAATTAPADLSAADKKFVEKAASAGLAEVQAAQLAQQKSSDPKVKDFAQTMITDHTEINQKLTALAQQKGVTVPTEVDSKDQKQLDKLGKLDGKKFDKAYMKDQVKDHETVLSLLQKEAKSGKDADLKSLAETTIPTIQKHLDMAKEGG
jgi:putative membrane protein